MKLKLILTTVVASLLCLNGYSQGVVSMGNATASAIIDGKTGATATSGAYFAGLYYNLDLGATATDADSFTYVEGSNKNISSGRFIGGTQTIPGTAPGQEVLLQVRVWEQTYASYEEQVASGQGYVGESIIMNIPLGGGPLPTPNLITQGGIQSFTTTPVPEPSVIALGILGALGGLVLIRRRK